MKNRETQREKRRIKKTLLFHMNLIRNILSSRFYYFYLDYRDHVFSSTGISTIFSCFYIVKKGEEMKEVFVEISHSEQGFSSGNVASLRFGLDFSGVKFLHSVILRSGTRIGLLYTKPVPFCRYEALFYKKGWPEDKRKAYERLELAIDSIHGQKKLLTNNWYVSYPGIFWSSSFHLVILGVGAIVAPEDQGNFNLGVMRDKKELARVHSWIYKK